jgi:hypothetical protein
MMAGIRTYEANGELAPEFRKSEKPAKQAKPMKKGKP